MTSSSTASSGSASPPAAHVYVRCVKETIAYEIRLDPEHASAVYNDIYRIQRDLFTDEGSVSLGESFPGLKLIYDGLYHAGCDGTA
jgi:hypothetical protein